jgi:predicted DCC family thiol-disulfide oxidoreductase YuxK
VNTEITDNNDQNAPVGRIYFDAACEFCSGVAEAYAEQLEALGYNTTPLQADRVHEIFELPEGEIPDELKIQTHDGTIIGGADALLEVIRPTGWGRIANGVAALPGVRPLLRTVYRTVAKRRRLLIRICNPRRTGDAHLWLLFLLPILLAAWLPLPGWAAMWALAAATFAGCKMQMWIKARRRLGRLPIGRSLFYLTGWPGMDPYPILTTPTGNRKPETGNWLQALTATATGAALLWIATPRIGDNTLLTAWTGMLGLIFILHFGLLHLNVLGLQAIGLSAKPIMNHPLHATSVADFWGSRWNLAFRD